MDAGGGEVARAHAKDALEFRRGIHRVRCPLDFLLVFSKGGTTSYCDGLTKVQKNAMEYQPTLLVVVPALLKVLNHRIVHTEHSGINLKLSKCLFGEE